MVRYNAEQYTIMQKGTRYSNAEQIKKMPNRVGYRIIQAVQDNPQQSRIMQNSAR